jgi:acylphosphatase
VKRLTASVHGQVQGVGFRWFAVRTAARLGLTGWVANQADGSVLVVAEGTDEALDEFSRLLATGPAGAHVTRVEAQRSPATGTFSAFTVRAAGHSGD